MVRVVSVIYTHNKGCFQGLIMTKMTIHKGQTVLEASQVEFTENNFKKLKKI